MASKKVVQLLERLAEEIASDIRVQYGDSISRRVSELLATTAPPERPISIDIQSSTLPERTTSDTRLSQPAEWPLPGPSYRQPSPLDRVMAVPEEDKTEEEIRELHNGLIEKLRLDLLPLEALAEPYGLTTAVLQKLRHKFCGPSESTSAQH